ncbi:hypothetical protein ACFVZH_09695 [Streptomyces sp. NPDC059534]|uniref:hypothetical protein n=1 Tax=Streptomyces sp. NPDC059534 TaxID=3346859 RepID=UPI0036AF0835
MSQHDPGAAGPRRGRRRHAPARRGRGPVWLIAAGGVGLLGLGAALFSGGSGPRGGSPADGGPGGPPALIQGDPSAPDAEPAATASTRPAAPALTPSAAPRTPGQTAAPSGNPPAPAATTPADGTPTTGTGDEAADSATQHPGRGRGLVKRQR